MAHCPRKSGRIMSFAVLGLLYLQLDATSVFADHHGPISPCHQYYPNIPGEVLLENEKVVVQRFIFPPGQWEGVHSHPPDQLYIHIKGGEWTVRYGNRTQTGYSETGSVGWYGPVALSADHESVNSGDEPIDLIWVTLKQGCMEQE